MNGMILALVFSATAIIAHMVVAPSAQTELVRQRILKMRRSRLARGEGANLLEEELNLPFAHRVIKPIMERFYALVLEYTPKRVREGLQLKLNQAGNPVSVGRMLGIQGSAALGASSVMLLLFLPVVSENPMMAALLIVIALLLGWTLPSFWLGRRINSRRHLIDRALPDVLDLLSVSVEAGLGMDGAIQKVGEKFPEPTSSEFRELLKQIRLGTARSDALRSLAERTGLPDMRTFAAAVIQAEQLGVSIARVLKVQSEAVRSRRKQKVEERAMALPIKMLFPLILFIFPSVFIIVLGPVVIGFVGAMSQ